MSRKDIASRNASPGYLAALIHRGMTRRIDAGLRPYGLTSAKVQPLLILAYGGPTLQRDIVARSAIGQSSMVVLLNKLQHQGLIEGERHPTDGRATLLSLTTAGRALVELAIPVIYAANDAALQGFSEEERERLSSLMQRFLENITDEHRPENPSTP